MRLPFLVRSVFRLEQIEFRQNRLMLRSATLSRFDLKRWSQFDFCFAVEMLLLVMATVEQRCGWSTTMWLCSVESRWSIVVDDILSSRTKCETFDCETTTRDKDEFGCERSIDASQHFGSHRWKTIDSPFFFLFLFLATQNKKRSLRTNWKTTSSKRNERELVIHSCSLLRVSIVECHEWNAN